MKQTIIDFLSRRWIEKEKKDYLDDNAQKSGLGSIWIAMTNAYRSSILVRDIKNGNSTDEQKTELLFMAGFYCGFLQAGQDQINLK